MVNVNIQDPNDIIPWDNVKESHDRIKDAVETNQAIEGSLLTQPINELGNAFNTIKSSYRTNAYDGTPIQINIDSQLTTNSIYTNTVSSEQTYVKYPSDAYLDESFVFVNAEEYKHGQQCMQRVRHLAIKIKEEHQCDNDYDCENCYHNVCIEKVDRDDIIDELKEILGYSSSTEIENKETEEKEEENVNK